MTSSTSLRRKNALLALSQLNDSEQVAALVGESLFAEASTLRDAALWISGFHPEWGETLAGHGKKRSAMSSSQIPKGSPYWHRWSYANHWLLNHPFKCCSANGWKKIRTFSSVDGLDSRYHGPGKLRKMPHAWVGVASRFLALRAPGGKQSMILDWMTIGSLMRPPSQSRNRCCVRCLQRILHHLRTG